MLASLDHSFFDVYGGALRIAPFVAPAPTVSDVQILAQKIQADKKLLVAR